MSSNANDIASPKFGGSSRKIRHARTRLKDAEQILRDYRNEVIVFCDDVGKSSHMVIWQIQVRPNPPETFDATIGDAIHSTRAALDVMMVEIARHFEIRTKNVVYPFAANADGLETILKKRIGHFPDFIKALVRETQPYKEGGTSWLRGLHDLDLADKHHEPMSAFNVITMRISPHIADRFAGRFEPESQAEMLMNALFTKSVASMPIGSTFLVKEGEDPRSIFQPIEDKIRPLLSDESPFPGKPIIPVTTELIDHTERLIEAFRGRIANYR